MEHSDQDPTKRPYTVIVAEPLALVREAISALCERRGQYRVLGHYEDGESALAAIEERRPDLAVLDFEISRLFVLEVVRKIRLKGLPTRSVILGTRSDRKTTVEVLRSGASGYVLKNGPGRHLLEAFQEVLKGGVYVSPLVDLEQIFIAPNPQDDKDPLETLSAREYQVFTLLIDGVRAKEIAARLELSPKTVDTYRASLMRKLGIHDVAGLVKFAIRRKLIPAG